MKKMTRFILGFICVLIFGATHNIFGQVAIVVNKANDVENVSLKELHDIFLGEMTAWSPRYKIYVVSLNSDVPIFRDFFEFGMGINQHKLRRAWIQLALSGRADPPNVLDSEEMILEHVARHKGAIGFVSFKNVSDAVKVVQVEGKSPVDSGYVLIKKNNK